MARVTIAQSVPIAIRSALPPVINLVVFTRVHERPDGLELVLAEDPLDPNYPNFQMCWFSLNATSV